MDFEKRLEKAIERGTRRAQSEASRDARAAMSLEELKRLHSQYRLELSEHIEACMRRLPDHFPGFRLETIVGDRGWGAAVSRDDMGRTDAGRTNLFSRLEMTVRPWSSANVLDLAAKGTVRNKEIFTRNQFQRLDDVELDAFREMVDNWTLEYAELYAAKS